MNFYRAQDLARKQTRWLVGLFVVAMLVLVLLTNLVVALFIWYSDPGALLSVQPGLEGKAGLDKLLAIIKGLGWARGLSVAGIVCGTIFIAMAFKWYSLRSGGRVVAEALGGRLIQPNTDQTAQKRLLNIVEEMALASGVPVPPVYLMQQERGINAFAAGLSLKDAVIGVSQGALDSLNREQLQGVIAHEFSHILNGDMRLNMKIIAVLHGMLMIGEAGQGLIRLGSRSSGYRSRRDNKGAAGLVLLGLALFVIGAIGQFFGALIKAAVSRQREFLADASAVQFTRNPDGIGGALRTIGGHRARSMIGHQGAHELGHLFFAQCFQSRLFATHPPLDERIRRVLPRWNGEYLEAREQQPEPAPVDPMQRMREQAASIATMTDFQLLEPAQSTETITETSQRGGADSVVFGFDGALSSELAEAAREPLEAAAIVLSILLDPDQKVLESQMQNLTVHASSWLPRVKRHHAQISPLDLELRLNLLERAMPAIKSLSLEQYQSLRSLMPILIRADDKVDLNEWLLFELVRQHGDRHFGLAKELRPKYKKPDQIEEFYARVASTLVYQGDSTESERSKAFGKAANAAGVYRAVLLPEAQCGKMGFARAVRELERCFPLLKPRLLKGLVQAAKHDGIVNAHEKLMISVIALIWDCPVQGLHRELD